MKQSIGVYLGRKEVIAARLSFSKEVPILERFAIEHIGIDLPNASEPTAKNIPSRASKKKLIFEKKYPSLEAEAIAKVMEKIGARETSVIASFNPFFLATRYFTMPFIPKKEWADAALFESKRHLPFAQGQIAQASHIVEQKAEDGNQSLAAVIAAVKLETLDTYTHFFHDAGVKVDHFEPAFSAYARTLAAIKELTEDKTYGLIFIDADGSVNITLARSGVTYLSHDFLFGDDRKTNETRFYEELNSSFNFVREKTGDTVIAKVFLAGSGETVFWMDFLLAVFGRETQFQYAMFPTKQDVPRIVMSTLIVPIGLALKEASWMTSPLGIFSFKKPLAQGEKKPERVREILKLEVLVIAILIVFLRFLILEPQAAQARKEEGRLLGPVKTVAPQLVSETLDGLTQKKEQLQNEMRLLSDFDRSRLRLKNKLEFLMAETPKGIWLHHIFYLDESARGQAETSERGKKKSPGSFQLEGFVFSGDSNQEVELVNNWVEKLSSNADFAKGFKLIHILEMKRDYFKNKQVTRFQVTCD